MPFVILSQRLLHILCCQPKALTTEGMKWPKALSLRHCIPQCLPSTYYVMAGGPDDRREEVAEGPDDRREEVAEGPDDRREEGLPVRDSNPDNILQRDVSYH